VAPDSILYNLEQVRPGAAGLHPRCVDLFRQHTLWEYSPRNIAEWARLSLCNVAHLPIGYVPQLTRVPRDEEDIDVLFYDSLNDRRQGLLSALRLRGVRTGKKSKGAGQVSLFLLPTHQPRDYMTNPWGSLLPTAHAIAIDPVTPEKTSESVVFAHRFVMTRSQLVCYPKPGPGGMRESLRAPRG
jgi:hypothetical protein